MFVYTRGHKIARPYNLEVIDCVGYRNGIGGFEATNFYDMNVGLGSEGGRNEGGSSKVETNR